MRHVFLATLLFLLGLPVAADDSPQFRGPGGAGVSKETGLPSHWSEKENIRWKAALPGRGLSCPVVAGKRVFVTACSGVNQDRLHVLCFDSVTGKELWHRQLWATGNTLCHPKTCMAAPTPVTDGKCVIALFATADLVCYDLDGNLLWYRSLTGDYPTVGNNVGMAASPILWRDLLLLCLENVGESFAAGIDKRTGRNRWRIERPRGINWVTPALIRVDGKDLVLFQGPSELSAHDPASGKKRWALTGQSLSTIPSPVAADGMIFVPGGKFLAVRPSTETGSASDEEPPQVLWQSTKLPASYSSPLYYRGLVYALSAKGILNCADGATGQALWSQRLEGAYAASPLAADGKIYVVSEEGTTTVLQAGRKPNVLATSVLPDKILASPVAAAGVLLLRSDNYLYCIAAK
jgi:outer membrane protein assembly factor BamB